MVRLEPRRFIASFTDTHLIYALPFFAVLAITIQFVLQMNRMIGANVLGFVEQTNAGPYDLVFLDPPFADVALLEATLAHPRLSGMLAPEARVVARVMRKHQPRLPDGASVARAKEIGEETLLFLRYDGGRGGG